MLSLSKCQYKSLQVIVSFVSILLLMLMIFPAGMFLDLRLHCFSVSFHPIGILDLICMMSQKEPLVSHVSQYKVV